MGFYGFSGLGGVSDKGPHFSRKGRARNGAPGFLFPGLLLPGFLWRILIAVLFLTSTSLLTGQGADGSGDADGKKFTLSGTVVNSVTGAPVARAMVEIGGGQQRSTMSNGDGRFEITGLPAGQTVVNAQKPGYLGQEQATMENGWGQPAMVEVGPETAAVVVKLVPESVIAGRITSNGEPAEDVPVKVISAQVVEGRRQWLQRGGATTDDEGEFRIANLPEGQYFLEVGPQWLPGGAGVSKGHEVGYEKVFYPSAPGSESATPLVVGPGQRAEMELSLKLEPWYRIKGTVRSTEGISNWNAHLIDAWGDREGASRNSLETGEFETRAPAGNYTLRVMGWGSRGPVGSANVPLTVNSNISGVQVELGAGTTIPVRVKTEASGRRAEAEMVSGSGFRFARQARGMPAVSMWLRHDGFFEGGVPTVRADEGGKPDTLALRDLEPGTYWVEMGRNSPWYVESAQCGSIDLLRESLTVGAGAPCAAIDVVLRDDGASLKVSGTWDGDPAQSMVVLLREGAPGQAMMAPILKGDEMEFSDLAPGEYSVLLIDRAGDLEYKNPEAMSGYMSKAARVTLGAGQRASVQAELSRR